MAGISAFPSISASIQKAISDPSSSNLLAPNEQTTVPSYAYRSGQPVTSFPGTYQTPTQTVPPKPQGGVGLTENYHWDFGNQTSHHILSGERRPPTGNAWNHPLSAFPQDQHGRPIVPAPANYQVGGTSDSAHQSAASGDDALLDTAEGGVSVNATFGTQRLIHGPLDEWGHNVSSAHQPQQMYPATGSGLNQTEGPGASGIGVSQFQRFDPTIYGSYTPPRIFNQAQQLETRNPRQNSYQYGVRQENPFGSGGEQYMPHTSSLPSMGYSYSYII